MAESSETKRSVPWVAVVGILFLLLACYPLSIGPVSLACKHRTVSGGFILRFYEPVFWLYNKCPPMQPAFDRYTRLWIGPEPLDLSAGDESFDTVD